MLMYGVVFQVLALGKSADTDRITVGGNDGDGLADVFRGRAIHDDSRASLEPVYRHVGRDDK